MHVKLRVKYSDNIWSIKVLKTTTVAELQFKIRKLITLAHGDAMFLFFSYDGYMGMKQKIYPQNRSLGDIQLELCKEILDVEVLLENCFGALGKQFIKARIEQRQGVFCAVITYSWYGVYHYDELSVHNTLNEATEHLLKIRCNGCLSLEVEKK